ncbi:MAG: PadR family transcriptional regulator [Anaerosomatales bacterium]|nr:PadR family transcriptional regulator [Anaerosomatales bacterium]
MSVKHGLLALLERRSMHGYELRRELEDELGPEWAVNYGQIYTTLERLERDGLLVHCATVSSEDAPDRKLYTATPAGRTELRAWYLSPVPDAESARDELYARIALALTSDVEVADIIQAQRKMLLQRIGRLTETKERLDVKLDLASVLRLDLAIVKTDAVIRWLDSAEAKIRRSAMSDPAGVTAVRRPGRTRQPDGVEDAEGATTRRGRT